MENSEWTYLPEVPDTNREVLVATSKFDRPFVAYLSRRGEGNEDWVTEDGDIVGTEFNIYAWRELPKMPPLPEDREIKKEFFPHGTKVKVVGWEKVTVLGAPMLVPIIEEDKDL